MPDFRAYIKEHLPPLGASGAKEAEIIEELALDFEERYKARFAAASIPLQHGAKFKARRNGLSLPAISPPCWLPRRPIPQRG